MTYVLFFVASMYAMESPPGVPASDWHAVCEVIARQLDNAQCIESFDA
mgnify:CR=1 FL=1